MKRWTSCFIATAFSLYLSAGITSATEKVQTKPGSPSECQLGSSAIAGLVDINGATEDQLKKLPGIDDTYCRKIIEGRPYTSMDQLVLNDIVPQEIFEKIRDRIIIIPPRK